MAQDARPVLNPVLNLKRTPRLANVTGRAPSEDAVIVERLEEQRASLSVQVGLLAEVERGRHADRRLVAVRMFDDSFAPSWEPEALFHSNFGSPLVAPFRGGYLAELGSISAEKLRDKVARSTKLDVRISVSRISSIAALDDKDILGGEECCGYLGARC